MSLSRLDLGVEAQEFPEGPLVVRADGCKLYPHPLAGFRPSYRSDRIDSRQSRWLTKDQPVLSAHWEGPFRAEAQTLFAHVLRLDEKVSFPCRDHNAKGNRETRSLPPGLLCSQMTHNNNP